MRGVCRHNVSVCDGCLVRCISFWGVGDGAALLRYEGGCCFDRPDTELAHRALGLFNAQELANTSWAFVKSSHSNAALVEALARDLERSRAEFNAQELANIVWALAELSQPYAALFESIARPLARRRGELSVAHLDF